MTGRSSSIFPGTPQNLSETNGPLGSRRPRRLLVLLHLVLLLLLLSFLLRKRVLKEGPPDAPRTQDSRDGDPREYLPKPLVRRTPPPLRAKQQSIPQPAAAYCHRLQQLTIVIPRHFAARRRSRPSLQSRSMNLSPSAVPHRASILGAPRVTTTSASVIVRIFGLTRRSSLVASDRGSGRFRRTPWSRHSRVGGLRRPAAEGATVDEARPTSARWAPDGSPLSTLASGDPYEGPRRTPAVKRPHGPRP